MKLIRWQNLLIIAFTQFLVRYFLIKEVPLTNDWRFLVLVFSTLFIAAAGYIINDYFDVKIDQINKPKEVFIGRIIKRRYALLIHQFFSGFGIFLGLFLGWKVFLINVFSVSILWLYASVLKKKPFVGNFIVAFLTGLSVSEIAVFYRQEDLVIHVYAIFAFFLNLIREIIKDIEDIKGDETHGARTLPIVLGIRKTKIVIYILLGQFVLAVVTLSAIIGNLKLWIVFGFLGIILLILVYRLILADRKIHFSNLSRWCKIIMLMGVASIVLL